MGFASCAEEENHPKGPQAAEVEISAAETNTREIFIMLLSRITRNRDHFIIILICMAGVQQGPDS